VGPIDASLSRADGLPTRSVERWRMTRAGWGKCIERPTLGSIVTLSLDPALRPSLLTRNERRGLDANRIAIVVVMDAPWPRLEPHVDRVVSAVDAGTPGSYTEVVIPAHLGAFRHPHDCRTCDEWHRGTYPRAARVHWGTRQQLQADVSPLNHPNKGLNRAEEIGTSGNLHSVIGFDLVGRPWDRHLPRAVAN